MSAADQEGNDVEDDCPLCLEPLPPFWDIDRRVINICCGKEICRGCHDKGTAFVKRAIAEGTYGKEEEQLNNFCPMCRSELPEDGCKVTMMQGKLEDGCLPLHFYSDLGLYYLNGAGGAEVDAERGMEILMLGAKKGDPECQFRIGSFYAKGNYGLPTSYRDAKRWLLAASEQGHAKAEHNLAIVFKNEGNDAELLRHLRSSASKGCDESCFSLGLAYCYGSYGLRVSTEEAIRVLSPAAERGHALSMGLLGHVMANKPFPRDNPNFTKGMHWARRGADKGGDEAIANLAGLEELASSECFRCEKEAPPEKAFLRCSRCRAAWYCSKDCQVQHWKAEEGGHKQYCIKWVPSNDATGHV